MDWYLQKITVRAYQTAYMYVKKYISQIPIKTTADKIQPFLTMVESISRLTLRSFSMRTPHDQTTTRRQIERANRDLDQIVYELYGLTEADIGIIEISRASISMAESINDQRAVAQTESGPNV